MQIINEPYSVIDWDNVLIEKFPGEIGFGWSRIHDMQSKKFYAQLLRSEYPS